MTAGPDAVPAEDRVAVFDNDGTLWCEKPMPIQLDFILRRLVAMAEQDPELRCRQPWQAAGEGLHAGRDSAEAVTDDYPGTFPWKFTGGTLHRVAVDISGEPYVDLEREAVAMLSRE